MHKESLGSAVCRQEVICNSTFNYAIYQT